MACVSNVYMPTRVAAARHRMSQRQLAVESDSIDARYGRGRMDAETWIYLHLILKYAGYEGSW